VELIVLDPMHLYLKIV